MHPVVIDLTRPLGKNTVIFTDGDYSDPEFSVCDWSSIDIHDFRVSSLRFGTQTGTHIDAPAHFDRNGACLDSLDISELMGSYYIIDLDDFTGIDRIYEIMADYRDEKFLFIRSSASSVSTVEYEAMNVLLALHPAVWVLDGIVKIAGAEKDKYFFNRMLAESGRYLVEDIDPAASGKIISGGELLIFPLRLENVSGSPCRVAVRYS